jgi:hypothetical protein
MVTVQLNGQATLKLTSGNNLNAEFFMLTPAISQAAPFGLAASQSAGQFLISFPTQSGHNYTVLRATNLTSSSWTPIGAPIPGNGVLNVVTQAVTGPASFFRVQAQ